MIKRNDKCEYCGGEMTAASIRKRFCSSKCRVYSKREKVYAEKYSPQPEVKSKVGEKWYDADAMKFQQDFEKKKFEELPPEFHQQLKKVITNVENKLKEQKKVPPAGLKGIDLLIWEKENL